MSRLWPPSAEMTSTRLTSALTNARDRPSGDHAGDGAPSPQSSDVRMRWDSPVRASTITSPPLQPTAIEWPSGDQLGIPGLHALPSSLRAWAPELSATNSVERYSRIVGANPRVNAM